jgi:hypothetical protein
MKLILACLLLAAALAQGATIYSGLQNIPIPLNFDGMYLNIFTGATSTTLPGDWNSAPWINPFFGGVDIGNDALLRPVITGADQVVNLAPGTVISSTSNFATGESGSSTHVGAAANQFQIGTPGFLGFAFESTPGGPTHYGWLQFTVNNSGAGILEDWVYEDLAGAAIEVGVGPEPARAILLLLGLGALAARRRR